MFFLYLFAFIWGFFILFALIGWGFLINQMILPAKRYSIGILASFGIASSIFIGGLLNLAGLITPLIIKMYLSVGLFLFILFILYFREIFIDKILYYFEKIKKNKILFFLVISILFIILVRYSFSVSFFGFHTVDDYQGYLAFPVKMMQTGSLGDDPFSGRRIVSSLGGQYFLNTFILSELGIKNLHLIDNGVGFLIFLLVLMGYLCGSKINLFVKLLLILVVCIIPSPSLNITSFFIGSVLIFSFFIIFLTKSTYKREYFILVSFIYYFRKERENLAERGVNNVADLQYNVVCDKLKISKEHVQNLVERWLIHEPLQYLKKCENKMVADFIKNMKEHGIKIVYVSDYPATEKIKMLGLPFDGVLCATDAAINIFKPSNKFLWLITHQYSVNSNQCLVVGDREDRDGKMAQNAGANFIHVNNLANEFYENSLRCFKV